MDAGKRRLYWAPNEIVPPEDPEDIAYPRVTTSNNAIRLALKYCDLLDLLEDKGLQEVEGDDWQQRPPSKCPRCSKLAVGCVRQWMNICTAFLEGKKL